ncbi:SRPBCC domain-containing protein [Jatrophihabitans telluris]|uniref:SRPBCC domain-containing protein n=1 Tax=Jatrophihabitans telluris TaxID=2038343 RepID=A0ABY4R0U8_9ACTN|nr:SRPBCC domain-containing protein [Jatrophihabitans telluris]UQX89218.1 SRPBCC domain-containing protein [Jatrophihabitans telluris]
MTDGLNAQNAVTIERTFDAPAHLIWQMWTDPEHFSAWYGPTGATIPVAKMDVRVGGTRLICMEVTTPDGPVRMWFTGEYREVIENARLVYTDSVSNADGDIIAPSELGMPAGHPTTTEVRVELEDLGDRTRMVITHVGIPADSPGATGWAMAMSKLAGYIETRA